MSALTKRNQAIGRVLRALEFGLDDAQLIVGWGVYALVAGALVLWAALIAGAAVAIFGRVA